jgi:hypothetical protein
MKGLVCRGASDSAGLDRLPLAISNLLFAAIVPALRTPV